MEDLLLGAVTILRFRAQAALDEAATPGRRRCRELMALAAHAFAIAEHLARDLGAGQLGHRGRDSPLPLVPPKLTYLRGWAELAAPPELVAFYLALERLLVFVQDQISGLDPVDDDPPPGSTELSGAQGFSLVGTVVHWLGGPLLLRQLRGQRAQRAEEDPALSPPRPVSPHPSQVLDRLFIHRNPPHSALLAERAQAKTRRQGSGLLGEVNRDPAALKAFRLALCPMPGASHPQFHISEDGGYFRAPHDDSFRDCAMAARHVRQVLTAAARQEIHLVVFPELMVCQVAQAEVVSFLQSGRKGSQWPLAVVAGSFHVDHGGPGAQLPFNRSRLLDSGGGELLHHHKQGLFRVTDKEVERFAEWFPVRPSFLKRNILESIRHDSTVRLLETPLGRVAIAICADCIADVGSRLTEHYCQLRPDLLVIVAMSPDTSPFERELENLSLHGVATALVNAANLCAPGQLLASFDLACFQAPGSPPTQARWLQGNGAPRPPEVRYFHPPAGVPKRAWVPLDEVPAQTGVALLRGEAAEEFGLVVDLGPHFQWQGRMGRRP